MGGGLVLSRLDVARGLSMSRTLPGQPPQALSRLGWRTLSAVQARVLPSDEFGPGARDVNAIGYLDAVLASGDLKPTTVQAITRGGDRLNAWARATRGLTYADLEEAVQDAGLRQDRSPAGRYFLSRMIEFTLEALFGDPVHGANPEETGWAWVQHTPGWPRPPHADWRPTERPT